MDGKGKVQLTQNQFAFLISGYLLGPSFIQFPHTIAKVARQDALVSAVLALIYPFFVIQISLFIIKRCPKENILEISKKCYGKILGTILNILFFIQFFVTMIIVSSITSDISLTFVVEFLTPLKIGIVTIGVCCFAAFKGIKTLGKINIYITYIVLLIYSASIYAVFDGTLLNLMPVFGSGFKSVLSGMVNTSYYYLGFEVILLYHNYVGDYKKIRSASYTALGIVSAVWIWTVFICIYSMGYRIVSKASWPIVNLFASVELPIVANFMYFLMIGWSLMNIKAMGNFYFVNAFILSDIISIGIKKITIALFPVFLWLGILMMNSSMKKLVLSILSPVFVIYNCIFFILTAIIISLKLNKKVRSEDLEL
jgi:spore germination protein